MYVTFISVLKNLFKETVKNEANYNEARHVKDLSPKLYKELPVDFVAS